MTSPLASPHRVVVTIFIRIWIHKYFSISRPIPFIAVCSRKLRADIDFLPLIVVRRNLYVYFYLLLSLFLLLLSAEEKENFHADRHAEFKSIKTFDGTICLLWENASFVDFTEMRPLGVSSHNLEITRSISRIIVELRCLCFYQGFYSVCFFCLAIKTANVCDHTKCWRNSSFDLFTILFVNT